MKRLLILVGVGAVIVVLATLVLALVIARLEISGGGTEFFRALQLLVSWPVVLPLLVLGAFGVFRQELAGFLNSMTEVGWGKFSARREQQSQTAESTPALPEAPASATISATAKAVFNGAVPAVGQVKAGSGDSAVGSGDRNKNGGAAVELTDLREQVSFWQENAKHWFFTYLGAFLRPQTKASLWWIAQRTDGTGTSEPSPHTYNLAWAPNIQDPHERAVILSVLEENRLIETTAGGGLRITPAGSAFLKFIGQRGEDPSVFPGPSRGGDPAPPTVADAFRVLTKP